MCQKKVIFEFMQTITQPRRGVRLHTALLFEEVSIPSELSKEWRSGRYPHLVEKRDNLLLYRLYYKTSIHRKVYEDVYKELEMEFFLSKTMLQKIIQNKVDQVIAIKRKHPSVQELREMFPFMVWKDSKF